MSKPFRIRRTVLAISSLALVAGGIALPATAMGASADVPQQVDTHVPGGAAEALADQGGATAICGDSTGTGSAEIKQEIKEHILEKLKEKLAN
ncbi:hypothetical protein ACWDYJ_24585 [Streptomyces sp. NPDC003042]